MVQKPKIVSRQQLAKLKSKKLSSDSLINKLHDLSEEVVDHRARNATVSLKDNIMSAFAVFALKESSLLAFENSQKNSTISKNIRSVFGIDRIPSDTSLRETVDGVEPSSLKSFFPQMFSYARTHHAFDDMHYLNNNLLLSIDGTGFFSSSKVSCQNCMQKKHKNGNTTFYHQILAAAIVHPDHKSAFPLDMEEICGTDGNNKNDCERNASKRLLERIRRNHPKLKLTILEDGLASNAPHLRCLMDNDFNFVTVSKPTDHKFLFSNFNNLMEKDLVSSHEIVKGNEKHCFLYHNDLALNESNQDLLVNLLVYWVENIDGKQIYYNSWVTNHTLTESTVLEIAKSGRTRWKIENETLNTLKNQGYNFEHNYGHGDKNLSTNFAILMMLAFLIDQLREKLCWLYKELKECVAARKRVWRHIFSGFEYLEADSMVEMYAKVLEKWGRVALDTS